MHKKYEDVDELSTSLKDQLQTKSTSIIANLKKCDYTKAAALLDAITENLKLSYDSAELNKQRPTDGKEKNQHPLKPIRGQIYNAFLGENLGSELSGEHPVIILQNSSGNLFSQKVNVVPIEGDGNKVKEPYQTKLTSNDLEDGVTLKKDPSRVIISDIMSIDKARLGLLVGKVKKEKMNDISKFIASQLEIKP
ncbi:type II toxin-antitoxin system PemK/MazF family toxin [Paenibacillus sp. NEAU-GSW1]|uniref:type II toxin-antitoxin system PemK/MazF family toxin n=1 Tax=Paenibacillus sp. NEAU-GSW1 TaxID=2682486 RepID=UPI0012E2D50A|nr:type II toxin-antitoxin system PemK/MazF family toxin [Paenibacillus sp. NEAU-GSW1]MUT68494.1 type II toxin-antitoxin system PemK/MazF family toxin [Paenibacillus sp. NEAU-GSW1]